MFYLINERNVIQIESEKFDIAENDSLFWVEADANAAVVGDKFDNGQLQPGQSLDDRRLICNQNVLSERNYHLYKNISYNNQSYFADQVAQTLIANALSSYERGFTDIFPANWILANGSVSQEHYDDIKAISGLLANRTLACYNNYVQILGEIAASSNPESVDVSSGWPA